MYIFTPVDTLLLRIFCVFHINYLYRILIIQHEQAYILAVRFLMFPCVDISWFHHSYATKVQIWLIDFSLFTSTYHIFVQGTSDDVVDCSHGKQLYELCQEKYEPLWLEGGNHCNLELYPEYLRHLKKFVSTVEKPPSQRNTSRRSIDRPEHSRRSTDCFETPRKSTDRREKPRRSTDRPEKLKNYEYKFHNDDKVSKLRMYSDHGERSRRSVEYHEKSRKSIDHQLEKARKSVDWLDRIRAV